MTGRRAGVPCVVVLVALAAACGGDRGGGGAEVCCPPPREALHPQLRIAEGGRCVMRWSFRRGCVHVSVDPSLSGRLGEVEDVLALWTLPDSHLCFAEPELLDGPPGDGEHWLHVRPPDPTAADETLRIEGEAGIIDAAAIELPADEFASPLVYRVGRLLSLEPVPDRIDSVMSGAPRPTDADLASVEWLYGPETTCQ